MMELSILLIAVSLVTQWGFLAVVGVLLARQGRKNKQMLADMQDNLDKIAVQTRDALQENQREVRKSMFIPFQLPKEKN